MNRQFEVTNSGQLLQTIRPSLILLINPPFVFENLDKAKEGSQCLGLRYLSSFLKLKGGHQVEILDAFKRGIQKVRRYANGYMVGMEVNEIVKEIPPATNIIGVSVPFSHLAPIGHRIIDEIKSTHPNMLVVMGGVYPSTQPTLALTSKADLIVVGEGEQAFLRIANGEGPKEITGVYSKNDIDREVFQPTNTLRDLDEIPFPDYSGTDAEDFFGISPRGVTKYRTASMITSRGCPFSCEFCSIHPVYGHKWRARSCGNILEEIKYLREKFNINHIEFEDDNFTLKKQRTVEILEGIIQFNKQGYGLSWSTPNGLRIDTLDAEIIDLMKRSNCKRIVLSLEHGDKEMLKIMNKRLNIEKAFEVIGMFTANKIPLILFLIAGYPGETLERFNNGIAFLKRVKKLGGDVSAAQNTTRVYPGTRLLMRLKSECYITDDNFDNFLIRKDIISEEAHITTSDFDEKEVVRRINLIEKIFPRKYARTEKMLRFFRMYTIVRYLYNQLQSLRGISKNWSLFQLF